jgi:hypothetical protein
MNVEQENTMRALKDQELLATNQWWCKFGIHTWEKYKAPVKNRRGVYDYIEQYRTCACCGRADRRQLDKI